MKVLIMAAGVGSRISRHLNNSPKCCVEIDGKPLIRNTIDLLNKKGIDNIAIVTGYQEKYVHQALEGKQYIRYFNPFYRVTNSLASAWFAREFLCGDDLVIMNGDVFMEEAVLDELLACNKSPILLSDSTRIEDADYRFKWVDNKLVKYGKELTNDETTGEYVGIIKISKNDLSDFKQRVIDAVSTEDYSCWWEEVIYRQIEESKDIHIKDIAGKFWAEVDYIEDYQRIIDYVDNKNIFLKDRKGL